MPIVLVCVAPVIPSRLAEEPETVEVSSIFVPSKPAHVKTSAIVFMFSITFYVGSMDANFEPT